MPHARIENDTPYYVGTIDIVCLPDALYDPLIGNIDGAREPNNPYPFWKVDTRITKFEDINKICQESSEQKNTELQPEESAKSLN